MKIGAITEHISEDLDHSLGVMRKLGLQYAEFCGSWNISAGRHDKPQTDEIVRLIASHEFPVSCVSPRSFYLLPVLTTEVGDEAYQADLADFRASIALAKRLNTTLVRALPFQRPPVIFGVAGAERALANQNRAWPQLLRLLETPVRIAEEEEITIAVETGFETMASSCSLAARMVKDIGSKNLRVMLDTGNNLYSTEVPYPEAYDTIREYLVHVQVKDARVDLKNGRVEFCSLGQGDLAEYLRPLADALRADGYDGVVSLENVYRPAGLSPEESFMQSVHIFREVFGET
jgi:sugar phosphate isomerase/epimerase